MMLGCCLCDFNGLPETSSEGSSSELGSTAEGSVSVGEYPPCGHCVGGVLPLRFLLTWPYSGTGNTARPCCDQYAGQDEYILRFFGTYRIAGGTVCEYQSDERNLYRQAGNCLTWAPEPRIRMGIVGNALNPGTDVTMWVRIQSRIQVGFGSSLSVLDYAGVIGQSNMNCVQSFTIPIDIPADWHIPGGGAGITDSPCDYNSQTIPQTVTLQPA